MEGKEYMKYIYTSKKYELWPTEQKVCNECHNLIKTLNEHLLCQKEFKKSYPLPKDYKKLSKLL